MTTRTTNAQSPLQSRVIDLLLSGLTIAEASQTVGVPSRTIYGWLRNVPTFLSALNCRVDERFKRLIREEIRDRIREAARHRLTSLDAALLDRTLDSYVNDPE